jgi:hypothetical protein
MASKCCPTDPAYVGPACIAWLATHIGNLTLNGPERGLGKLMHLDGEIELGVHAYQLVLEKDSESINYATIVETHHPDYMSLAERESLYGDGVESKLDDADIRALSALIMESD